MAPLTGFELLQRAHSPKPVRALRRSRLSGAAGLGSESKNGKIPNSRCEALPSGGTFSAACCRELQMTCEPLAIRVTCLKRLEALNA